MSQSKSGHKDSSKNGSDEDHDNMPSHVEKQVKAQDNKVEIIIKQKLLGQAPVEKHFVVTDGRRIKSVKELIDAFEQMSDDAFKFHANEHKNDFATWLRDVFSEEGMAKEIEHAKHKLEAQRALMRHILKDIEKITK